MTNDIAQRQLRRRLETLQLPVPRPEVLEEVIDWIDNSDSYYTIAQHNRIVGEAVREWASGDSEMDWNDAYDRGYEDAIGAIEDLALKSDDQPVA